MASINQTCEPLGWPQERSFFLTLDLECDFGTALAENSYGALDHIDHLVSVIEQFQVPLTCFVQTEVLDEQPAAVESLIESTAETEFHPHSHTHRKRTAVNVRNEIETSRKRYQEFFGRDPTGYRFPNGNIRASDYMLLETNGFLFDASIFPSWRPGYFSNSDALTQPCHNLAHNLVEIPFTVFSNRLRIPTSLSYCRLLGRPYSALLFRRPPPAIVFNIHMHDLVNPPAFGDLERHYQYVYSRNQPGMAMFKDVLKHFSQADYKMGTLSDLYDSFGIGS